MSETYVEYDLNNEPKWIRDANPGSLRRFEYHSSGRLKSSSQILCPTNNIAYTLYEYDTRGNLVEEIDPLGYCTTREYDALGNVEKETKEGHSILFTYEAGGLVESITSPSGGVTSRYYTTNGLPKEQVYPDGTSSSIVYDLFGRPVREIKNGIVYQIAYDDINYKITRTHVATGLSESQEFDARGNIIRQIDGAGFSTERSYDGLNRVKTEKAPNGDLTFWNYDADAQICVHPNGEKTVNRYEGSRIASTEVFDALGNLNSRTTQSYDPTTNIRQVVQGDIANTTWMNALGLPLMIKNGDLTLSYEYDALGNCIASTDGEGKTTHQKFDSFGRISQKILPDGTTITYKYDLDSNMIECNLHNDTTWKASYDLMGRKCFEERRAGNKSSERWEYTYQNGFLTGKKDPINRIHTYHYDSHGRIACDMVNDWQRTYSYDPRGLLASVEQQKNNTISWFASWVYSSNADNSRVERTYDELGRIATESVYLNSQLVQHTTQSWTTSTRTLQVGNHRRDFTYQNQHLSRVTAEGVDLTYFYTLDGSLQQKITPLSSTTLRYDTSALPTKITTDHMDGTREQNLSWDNSGKISTYSTEEQQKQFTYSLRGFLQKANDDIYEFDFGGHGAGVLTQTPHWYIPQDGLDIFGKVISAVSDDILITTRYDEMGQVVSHNNQKYEWDPWGQLLKVTGESFTWEATYDGLGRRLQTRYKPSRSATLTTTSFYDPQTEFQEIGVMYDKKTFWKIFGPQTCEAILDDSGQAAYLSYDVMGHLTEVITASGVERTTQQITPYGPTAIEPLKKHDLISVALAMNWHSKCQDPTGLIWMGARYYDPQGGRFISPDPIGYPINTDLYAYAGGDPINNYDPDGRFFSPLNLPIGIASLASVGCSIWGHTQLVAAHQGSGVNQTISYYDFERCFPSSIPSHIYNTGGIQLPSNMGIGFINGICNTFKGANESAMHISKLCGGYNIYGVYNATHGWFWDLHECYLGLNFIATEPVRQLHKMWTDFFANRSNDAMFLMICHSQGAIHVRNALMDYPEELRKQILVVAIAPAAYIDQNICADVVHYRAAEGDFVPRIDSLGAKNAYGSIIEVQSQPNAPWFDHEFASPTYQDHLDFRINRYISSQGKNL